MMIPTVWQLRLPNAKHMSIDVLPPDVNESFLEFAVVPETNQIRFGMNAKNVGTAAVEEILRARKKIPLRVWKTF